MNRGQTPAIRTKSHTMANVALAVASCLAGFALVEVALRVFHPKYEHLAAAPFVRDPILRYAREPNRRGFFLHPDTGERHPFHHNNFGSRQHRNFSAADLEPSVNVGFFGDSFTENARMDAPFSFTEPLDHLLNVNARQGAEGRGFNLLNFGVDGYSTHQSLLRYETWALRGALDHVFYVYFENDLVENQAFHAWRPGTHPFAPLGKLHLSHLVLYVAGRLSTSLATRDSSPSVSLKRGLPPDRTAALTPPRHAPDRYTLFRQLLRRFKAAAEGDGASFQLVRLPDIPCDVECRPIGKEGRGSPESFSVATIVAEEGVETVNLQNCFAELAPAHARKSWWRSPLKFRGDAHWNEAGNRLAAVCLHRFLAGRLGLPPLPRHEVAQVLDRYYAAFEAPAPADPAAAAIRARYAALRADAPVGQTGLPAPWAPSPDKLVIRSHFDVYLHDGWLAYVREDCQPDDLRARFALHVVPRDLRHLSAERLPLGFDNMDFNWHSATRRPDHRFFEKRSSEAGACMTYRKLPDYAIERIRAGQFIQRNGGVYEHLWRGERVLAAARPRTGPMP